MTIFRATNKDHFSRLKISGLLAASALMLTGCITVQAPETETQSPTPSGTTFTAQPRETQEQATEEPETQPIENEQTVITQDVDYSISGGCQDSYEQVGYYGIFEEFNDDCYLIVEVYPPEPSRFAELQFFDSTWTTESSGYTDSEGILYLEVDQYCEDGYWCEGVWEFRVAVAAEGSLPADRSITFELEFLPY